MTEKDRNRPILPEPKTEAAKQARRNFDRGVAEQLRQEEQIAFSILVWGMSPHRDAPIARKRKDIANELLKKGHHAMFSEELTRLGDAQGLSEKSKEFAQAKTADLVIILVEDSPGALAEACDFCNHPDLAQKIYVMAPYSYKAGYAGQGALKELDEGYGGVYWYEQGDVEACNVLTEACKRVRARRSMTYRHQSGKAN
ncbi:MAG: hypothetical protein OXF97_07875 [Nitrospira sp.]|nr:hypothetical protein [Nitrospira sp.]